MEETHRLASANSRRSEDRRQKWPELIQSLEICFDDAERLQLVLQEARLMKLPQEVARPFELQLQNLLEQQKTHQQLLADLKR